jgi:putative nucleotidyltransferase with HDIG domain
VKERALSQVEPTDSHPEPHVGNVVWALKDLPPFPAVATRLFQVVSQDDADLNEAARFISAEPVLAAEVLQVANSALVGLGSSIKSITQAILMLGFDRIKAITLTRVLDEYLKSALRISVLRRCWQHSLAGALLAEKLAPCCGMNPDVAYTGGLLRDIGRLVLLVKYPVPFANMLEASQEHGFHLMSAERDLFDVDHCQAGATLVANMPLPPEMVEVICRHHADLRREPFGLVHLVQAADLLAESLGFGVLLLPEPTATDFASAAERLPPDARRRFTRNSGDLKREVLSKIRILSRV